MSKRISELSPVATANPSDLVELAIVDGASPTGYSSRRINVSQLIPPSGSSCRYRIDRSQEITSIDNTYFIDIPLADMGDCATNPAFTGLRYANFRVSLSVVDNTDGYSGSSFSEINFDITSTSSTRYLGNSGKYNTSSIETLPLTAADTPPVSGMVPLVYDVLLTTVGSANVVRFVIKLSTADDLTGFTINSIGYVDYSLVTESFA